MLKKTIALCVLLVVILAACQSSTASPTALPSTEIETSQSGGTTPSQTAPPLPEVSPTPTTDQALIQAEANCTVVSRQPTPGPTEQSIVPPVSDLDWAHGPEDAKVTIIEYGDFQ
jgi:hypothetical protein